MPITRRSTLLATAALATAFLAVGPALSQDDKPLVIAYPNLGKEIFSPLTGTLPELSPATIWGEFLIYSGPGAARDLRPGLAKSWEISDDGRTYTFHLRDDVKFSDGTPMTAADVIFTFDLIGDPDSVNGRRNVAADWIETKEAVDDHTVRITLKQPQSAFLRLLSNLSPYVQIVSKAYFEKVGRDVAGQAPVGTGPYRIVEHLPRQSMELEAVPNHWRKQPGFQNVEIRIAPDETSRVAMLKTGEADIIAISAASIKDVQDAGFKVIQNDGASFMNIGLGGQVLDTREGYNAESPWASQVDPERSRKVREAMCLAINRDEIQQRIFYGTGAQFGVNQFLPGGPFTKAEWTPYPYDPARAKQLLDEAGYSGGFDRPIIMYINRGAAPETPDVAEAVSMYWEQLGLTVQRRVVDDAIFRQDWWPRTKMQDMGTYIMGSTPQLDPIDWFMQFADVNALGNQLFESNEISTLIQAVNNEQDPAKAAEMKTQLGEIVYDGYMACSVVMISSIFAVSDRVDGWELNNGNRYLHNVEFIKAKE